MTTLDIPQPPHLVRRPRWEPIIPPKPVYPVYHEATLTPTVLLRGALEGLPTSDLTLGLFFKLTPEGTGIEEPPAHTGYRRQPVDFGSLRVANGSTSSELVAFKFASDEPAPTLIGLFAEGRVIMRARFAASQVWVGPDLEDGDERQLRLTKGALRLRFS